MISSKRLAKDEREQRFEALAAFANMGDKPEDWRHFRLMYPDFFPSDPSGMTEQGFENLTEWLYSFAEECEKTFADLSPDRRPISPLLWYRNRLRSVWARNDRHGYSLAILLGFESESRKIAQKHPGEIHDDMLARPAFIPGESFNPMKQESHGLPQGRPIINGVTGEIRWEFGCGLQQAVYELMQDRWRSKVCPKCGRFFVATKTRQTFCSIRCSETAIRERALRWYHEVGSERRREDENQKRRESRSKRRGK